MIQPAAASPSESPNTAICPCATNSATAAVTNTGHENRRYRAAATRSGRSRSRYGEARQAARIAARLPQNGPITSAQTPTPASSSGTATTTVPSGTIACSVRSRTYSMRLKKTHCGACSANATGR